ncbi:MAG: DUF1565 domain-containing protein [Acidobacteria bacterium]|nr:MAG: DUF1565 domain-containing protein [Acidobacteriota bacterium]
MRIRAHAYSHPGRERSRNEDRVYSDEHGRTFVVVDGMGGQAAGEKAADEAMAAIRRRLKEKTGEVERRIREAIWHANEEILRLASTHDEYKGMGCVLTVAVIEDGYLFIGHVGDTRLYEIRDGSILKITHDHSPVGVREDAGEIDELEAMRHPRRNEVYRDVGSAKHDLYDDDFIEFVRRPFYSDAALVLCSDGLSDMITAEEIRTCVQRFADDGRNAACELVNLANEKGGKDNVSVIVVTGEEFASRAGLKPFGKREVRMAGSEQTDAGRPSKTRFLRTAALFLAGMALGMTLLALVLAYWPDRVEPPPTPPAETAETFAIIRVGKGRALDTIQRGLLQAKVGDAIEVDPGVYEGPIELKDGVRVVAREPGTAIIEAEDLPPGQSAAVRGQSLRSASLEGFVVRAKQGRNLAIGIRLLSSRATIADTEVTGTYSIGIWLEGDSQGTLVGNRVHENLGTGLMVEGRSRVTLNRVEKNGVAIVIGPDSGALKISGNVVRGNKSGVIVPSLEWKTKVEAENLLVSNRARVRGPGVQSEPGSRRAVPSNPNR